MKWRGALTSQVGSYLWLEGDLKGNQFYNEMRVMINGHFDILKAPLRCSECCFFTLGVLSAPLALFVKNKANYCQDQEKNDAKESHATHYTSQNLVWEV